MKKSMIGMRVFIIVKRSSGLRALFSIVAAAMVFTIVSINTAYGQNDPGQVTAVKQQYQYPTEELELLRSKILELLDAVQDFSSVFIANNAGEVERLATARKQLEQFTLKDLNALRAIIDPAKLKDLRRERARLNELKPIFDAAKRQSRQANSTLPGVDDPLFGCSVLIGAGRPSVSVIIDADRVYFAAKMVDAALNRGCNQVDVGGTITFGFGSIGGGNHSNVCVGSDHILITAEEVRNVVDACNVDFTNRSVDAAVQRLETIHSDLQGSEQTITSAVNAATTVIDTKATDNLTTLIQNALANTESLTRSVNTSTSSVNDSITAKTDTLRLAVGASTTTLATAVGDGTSTLINNDNTNKTAIVTNDNANRVLLLTDAKTNRDVLQADARTNRDFLQADAKANRDFLQADAKTNREFLLRTQIEADLSSTDGASFVALFLTPSTTCSQAVLNDKGLPVTGSIQCGYLDFARAVVVQTIANLAGTSAAQANSFLAKGDAARNSGDYKQAYVNYRLAYKTAIK